MIAEVCRGILRRQREPVSQKDTVRRESQKVGGSAFDSTVSWDVTARSVVVRRFITFRHAKKILEVSSFFAVQHVHAVCKKVGCAGVLQRPGRDLVS